MTQQQEIKKAVQAVIRSLMDRVMQKVLVEDPFMKEKHKADKPLYAALVPNEIFKGSHFERRFVTPFGHVWEELAKVVAEQSQGFAKTGHAINGVVKEERLRRISEVLNRLEHPGSGRARHKPDWKGEVEFVLDGGGKDIPVTVICDLYTENSVSRHKQAFEIKAPLPNSDQTKVSKEKLLKLYAMEPRQVNKAYYALPYNPYGRRKDYSWSFPARWFNMIEDEVVLIGDEFWDALGGPGTYRSFIAAVNEVGGVYKERIYREFLGIEPPPESLEEGL
jgi:hypothetical protein